jgi:hypothetical protein
LPIKKLKKSRFLKEFQCHLQNSRSLKKDEIAEEVKIALSKFRCHLQNITWEANKDRTNHVFVYYLKRIRNFKELRSHLKFLLLIFSFRFFNFSDRNFAAGSGILQEFWSEFRLKEKALQLQRERAEEAIIAEVSCPKNSSHNVSRISTRILLTSRVKFLKES